MRTLQRVSLVVWLLVVATPARAQIYSWRDANGTLVLSDRPLSPDAQTFAVPRSDAVRVTKAAARPYRRDFDELIEQNAAGYGIRPDLVRAVIQVESGFNPRARSSKGALGLMQLLPATAAEFGVQDPMNAADNIRGGVAYLRHLLTVFDENEELALAAYNAGPGAVERYGRQIPPYRETRDYVSKVRTVVGATGRSPAHTIYKTIELVDGRPVPRYSGQKPTSGPYEVVTTRR